MKDRLRQFLAAENISQAQFADTINVVRASVSHILAGRNNPSFDFIKALMLNYPRLNVEWLMFGKGKMYKDSPAELLFPEFDEVPAEPVPEMPEIKETVQHSEEKPVSFDINTLIDTTQTIKNQRKVAKIIILFDDGSYQEM
jgi:transcriptional regulator with XRE-family HTH domain